jgi:uncharacterized protein YdgA (DUF945 family)
MAQPKELLEPNGIPEIRNEDFESISVHLSFFNITTKTEVSEGKRYIGDQLQKDTSAKIDLVEFREDGMVIEVPARSGAEGHQLKIDLWTEGAKENIQVTFIVTVYSVQKMGPTRDQFEVNFNEYDPTAWRQLQSIYQSRQGEIEAFLKAAKGY